MIYISPHPHTNETQYGFVKRAEHFWKGLTNVESQISAIPPERYGDRFVRFISGVAKTREAAEAEERGVVSPDILDDPGLAGINVHPRDLPSNQASPRDGEEKTEKVMERAERQAERSKRHGANENAVPNKTLTSARSPSAERGDPGGYTLPVVEEDVEGQSMGGRSGRSARSNDPSPSPHPDHREGRSLERPQTLGLPPPLMHYASQEDGSEPRPPPTPPKDRPSATLSISPNRRPNSRPLTPQSIRAVDGDSTPPEGNARAYTPPKDSVVSRERSPNRDKALPPPPPQENEGTDELVLRPFDAS